MIHVYRLSFHDKSQNHTRINYLHVLGLHIHLYLFEEPYDTLFRRYIAASMVTDRYRMNTITLAHVHALRVNSVMLKMQIWPCSEVFS